jgi:hypothetical protein
MAFESCLVVALDPKKRIALALTPHRAFRLLVKARAVKPVARAASMQARSEPDAEAGHGDLSQHAARTFLQP